MIQVRRNCKQDEQDDILVVDTGADQSIICCESWVITHRTKQVVKISAYLQEQPPTEHLIVSACAVIIGDNGQKWLVQNNEAIWVEGKDHCESLLHPFQAMGHGVQFDMTPIGHKTANNEIGKKIMVVGVHTTPIRPT